MLRFHYANPSSEWHYVGKTTFSNTIDIADPCCEHDLWRERINSVDVKPGEYHCYAETHGFSQGNPAKMVALPADSMRVSPSTMENKNIFVRFFSLRGRYGFIWLHTGIAGFFSYNNLRNEKECNFWVLNHRKYKLTPYGFFSRAKNTNAICDVYTHYNRHKEIDGLLIELEPEMHLFDFCSKWEMEIWRSISDE